MVFTGEAPHLHRGDSGAVELGAASRWDIMWPMELIVIIWPSVAALTLGTTFLAPYYLATVTTLMLLVRCVQTNNKNKRYHTLQMMRLTLRRI